MLEIQYLHLHGVIIFTFKVHVLEKTIFEAAERALDTLDLIRGAWNYYYNRGRGFRITTGGKRTPVNAIVTGPFHTLHKPNGRACYGPLVD